MALESDGSGSKLNAPLLTSVTGNVGQQYSSTLQASNSGSLLVPEVATFDAGTIVDQGATLSLTALGNIDGSSVLVSSGSQLSLPALLTFSGGANYTETLQATGAGSRLSLPALTKVTEDTSAYSSLVQVKAVSGGDVELRQARDDQRRPGGTGKRRQRQQAECSFTDECNRPCRPAVIHRRCRRLTAVVCSCRKWRRSTRERSSTRGRRSVSPRSATLTVRVFWSHRDLSSRCRRS